MKKKIICIAIFLAIVSTTMFCFASSFDEIKEAMKPVTEADTSSTEFNSTAGTIIKLIQYVGSGIALIVITMYGIKYMLASPQDKADIKKQIVPIIVGCVLIFATVNIVGFVADTTNNVLGEGGGSSSIGASSNGKGSKGPSRTDTSYVTIN